jgi:addiction module HigA family antidote
MRFPVHPGEILRADVLADVGLDIAQAADRLGVSRVPLNRVVDGHAAMSPDLASRLALAGVGTARSWLKLQATYEIVRARAEVVPAARGQEETPTVTGSCEPALRRGL